jgi:hypothetical protein
LISTITINDNGEQYLESAEAAVIIIVIARNLKELNKANLVFNYNSYTRLNFYLC